MSLTRFDCGRVTVSLFVGFRGLARRLLKGKVRAASHDAGGFDPAAEAGKVRVGWNLTCGGWACRSDAIRRKG